MEEERGRVRFIVLTINLSVCCVDAEVLSRRLFQELVFVRTR